LLLIHPSQIVASQEFERGTIRYGRGVDVACDQGVASDRSLALPKKEPPPIEGGNHRHVEKKSGD